jgi:hypothetical protein
MFTFVCRNPTIAAISCASAKLTPIIVLGVAAIGFVTAYKQYRDNHRTSDGGGNDCLARMVERIELGITIADHARRSPLKVESEIAHALAEQIYTDALLFCERLPPEDRESLWPRIEALRAALDQV